MRLEQEQWFVFISSSSFCHMSHCRMQRLLKWIHCLVICVLSHTTNHFFPAPSADKRSHNRIESFTTLYGVRLLVVQSGQTSSANVGQICDVTLKSIRTVSKWIWGVTVFLSTICSNYVINYREHQVCISFRLHFHLLVLVWLLKF